MEEDENTNDLKEFEKDNVNTGINVSFFFMRKKKKKGARLKKEICNIIENQRLCKGCYHVEPRSFNEKGLRLVERTFQYS